MRLPPLFSMLGLAVRPSLDVVAGNLAGLVAGHGLGGRSGGVVNRSRVANVRGRIELLHGRSGRHRGSTLGLSCLLHLDGILLRLFDFRVHDVAASRVDRRVELKDQVHFC